MNKKEVFKIELNYIKNEEYRKSAEVLLELAPDYFYEVPAASTGKYHPEFAQGDRGLIRHTKVALKIAKDILELEYTNNIFTDNEKDLMLIAIMFHDCQKLGNPKEKYTRFDHPLLICDLIMDNEEVLELEVEEIEFICDCIKTHMGVWTKDYNGVEVLEVPKTKYQNFVHMCDYLASKKFLNIPFDKDNNISA